MIAFVTAGDPNPELTPKVVEALSERADLIELGIPFSDPIADGPTIQCATDRALRSGTTPETVLGIVRKIRGSSEVPLIVLTYYNPIFKMGVENFVRRFSEAGTDGFIVPDLPVEEAGDMLEAVKEHGIDFIPLAAPTSTPERLRRICEASSGFLYAVSLLGVTGAREKLSDSVGPLLAEVRKISRIPVAVGFGISKPEHVTELMRCGADGAIVGSAFVNLIAKNLDNEGRMFRELGKLAEDLKAATRRLRSSLSKPPIASQSIGLRFPNQRQTEML